MLLPESFVTYPVQKALNSFLVALTPKSLGTPIPTGPPKLIITPFLVSPSLSVQVLSPGAQRNNPLSRHPVPKPNMLLSLMLRRTLFGFIKYSPNFLLFFLPLYLQLYSATIKARSDFPKILLFTLAPSTGISTFIFTLLVKPSLRATSSVTRDHKMWKWEHSRSKSSGVLWRNVILSVKL